MPDAPNISTAEIATAGPHEIKPDVIKNAFDRRGTTAQKNLEEGRQRAESTRKARAENPSNDRETMASIITPVNYSSEQLVSTKSKITVNEVDEKVANYVIAARKAKPGVVVPIPPEFIQKIITDGRLVDKLPDLAGISDPKKLATFVEAAFAKDPWLLEELAREYSSIDQDIQTRLKSDPQAEEIERAKEEKDDLEKLQNDQIEIVRSELVAQGIRPETIEQILKTTETGDASFAAERVYGALIETQGLKNISGLLESYQSRDSAVKEAERDLKDLQNKRRAEMAKAVGKRNEALIESLNTDIDTKNSQIETETKALARVIKTYNELASATRKAREARARTAAEGATEPAGEGTGAGATGESPEEPEDTTDYFEIHVQAYNIAKNILTPENSMNRALQFIATNGTRLKEARRTHTTLSTNTEVMQREETRTGAKKEISERFENAVATAMGKYLGRKYDAAVASRDIVLGAAAKDAEKKGEKWMADSLKSIKEQQDGWGKFDKEKRKRVYYRDKIATSMKNLASYISDGKDGGRYLMAEQLGISLDPEEAKKQMIIKITGAGKTYDTLTPDQKIQVDTALTKQTADFDRLYQEHGTEYTKRLITDFVAARGMFDRSILGKGIGALNLTDDEWKAINGAMGSIVEKEIESNKDSKQKMDELRSKGIVPDSKMKWLIWLLGALGIGAVAYLGVVPVATVVGSTAKAVGSRVLQGPM